MAEPKMPIQSNRRAPFTSELPELVLHAVPSCGVTGVLLSEDGHRLFVANADRPIQVWDVSTRRLIRQFMPRSGGANALALSPGSRLLAVAGYGGVELWDPERAVWLGTLPGLADPIGFQENGKYLVALEPRRTGVAVVAVESGAKVRRLSWGEELDSFPWPFTLSADGSLAAVTQIPWRREDVELWDLHTGEPLYLPLPKIQHWMCALFTLSPDGKQLVYSDGNRIRRFELASGTATELPFPVIEAAGEERIRATELQYGGFSQDGTLFVAAPREGHAQSWHLPDMTPLPPGPLQTGMTNGFAMAVAGNRAAVTGDDGSVRIWNPRTGEQHSELPYFRHEVTGLGFSPDSISLAVGLEDGSVRIWSLRIGGLAQTLHGSHIVYDKPVFSPDHATLSMGTGPDAPRWKLATGELLVPGSPSRDRTFVWHYPPECVTSPDGRWEARALPASEAADETGGEIALHHRGSPEPTHFLTGRRTGHYPLALVFSPDSRVLVSTSQDHGMYFWEVDTGKCLRWVSTPDSANASVAFSPDGRLLATGSVHTGPVQLWCAETGAELELLESHPTGTRSLAFSPDGQWLAGGGADGSVRLWKVEIRKLWLTFRILPFGGEAITEDWLTTTRKPYYQGSPGVERHFLWRVGTELLPGETFASRFRRPQRIANLLGFAEEDERADPAREEKPEPPPAAPAWVRTEGEAALVATPHKARLQVGEALHFDVFLWNRSEEPVWVERRMRWGLQLWVHIKSETGEDVDFPRIKLKVAAPTSRDHFLQLQPEMCLAKHDLTRDEIILPEPGWYTVTVEHGRWISHLCAACFGIALADIKPAHFQVHVEEPK